MAQPTHEGLVRGIRRWDLIAVAINGIIGAGIFGLPSKVYGPIGAYSLIAFAVCALVVTLIILCFAEVGSRFTETGGPYLYAREAFGSVVGFEVGWLNWLARVTAFAANCNLLVEYFSYFFPAAGSGWLRAAVIITVVAVITAVNIGGVRDAALFSNVFTVGKLVPIVLFIACGLFFLDAQNFSLSRGTGLKAEYFKNASLEGTPARVRTDPIVGGDRSLNFIRPGEPLSVRWSGRVKASHSENYTFHVASSGGVKLTLDGAKLIEAGPQPNETQSSAAVLLVAGQQHEITVEYTSDSGEMDLRVEWSSASTARQVIPQAGFFPAARGYGAFSLAVLLLIYAFTGFEMAAIPAGEARNPRRDLPLALLTAIAVVAAVYILIQVVFIGTSPEMVGSERPLADASGHFLGAAGAAIISAGALISITGNLNVILLAASRLPFAMAEGRDLPRLVARTHPRFRTPWVSILLTAAVVLALTLSGTFIYALTLSAIARLVTYAATCAALPVLRRKEGIGEAMFKVPFGLGVSIAVLALTVWLLSNSTRVEMRDSAIAAGIGLVIYGAYRVYRLATPR
ncbi:MAG TPA: amino acid permease [Blastocatellia bacterium]|nr:amino acid permease [Blastocatellia bacterium]